jgi:hypothetical protein
MAFSATVAPGERHERRHDRELQCIERRFQREEEGDGGHLVLGCHWWRRERPGQHTEDHGALNGTAYRSRASCQMCLQICTGERDEPTSRSAFETLHCALRRLPQSGLR